MIFMLFGNLMIDPLKISSNSLPKILAAIFYACKLSGPHFVSEAYRYISTLYRKYKWSANNSVRKRRIAKPSESVNSKEKENTIETKLVPIHLSIEVINRQKLVSPSETVHLLLSFC